MTRRVVLFLATIVFVVPASAAQAVYCPQPTTPAVQRAQPQPELTQPDDAFGFLDGTAVSEPCDIDTQTEIASRFGKRDGVYRGINYKFEANFLIAPRWQISIAIWQAYHTIRDNTVPGYPNQNRSAFDGLAAQVTYHILERGERPFEPGFALGVEYRWARFSEGVGLSAERLSVALKGAVDMAIYSNRLYGSVNFNIAPGTEHVRNTPGYVNDSVTELSTALTYRLQEQGSTFVGVNARYLTAFNGAFLNKWAGHAVMVGPTLFHEFGTVGGLRYPFLSLTWTPQIWGRAAGGVTGGLDLVNFERHQLRLRIGATF